MPRSPRCCGAGANVLLWQRPMLSAECCVREETGPGSIALSQQDQYPNLLHRPAFEIYGFHYKPMLFFLWGLTSSMRALTGRDLLPTYDYFRIYRERDVCRIFAKLGASVSVMPGTEVYTALDTGKIEATDWGTLSVNDEAGYNRIAPYAIYPGIHSMNSIDFVLSKRKWNALSAEQKAIVTAAVDEWSLRTWMSQELEDRKAVAKRDPATLVAWGEKEKAEFRKISQDVWEKWSKKSPLAKQIYESQVKFLKSIGKL